MRSGSGGSCRCRRPRPTTPRGRAGSTRAARSTAGPSISVPGDGAPRRTSSSTCSPPIVASRVPRSTSASSPLASERDVRAGHGRGHADRDQLERLLGVAVAVAILVLGLERLAQLLGLRLGRRGDRQLERLPAVAQLVGRAAARRRPRRARSRARSPSSATAVATASAVSSSPASSTLRWTSRRRGGDDQPERRQALRTLAGTRSSRSPARRRSARRAAARRRRTATARSRRGSMPALHGHDPQRPDHLGARDAPDPLRAVEQVEPELVGERADRVARRRRGRAPRRPPAARRMRAGRARGSRR